jgi:hypothetical protein
MEPPEGNGSGYGVVDYSIPWWVIAVIAAGLTVAIRYVWRRLK